MSNNYEVRMEIDLSTAFNFSRHEVKTYALLAEFIDNSFQSYIDHERELRNSGTGACVVDISVSDGCLTIADNAYGMDREGVMKAVSLKSSVPNRDSKNLGKYGVGMKESILCFGRWAKALFETKLFQSPVVCRFAIENSKIRENEDIINVTEDPAENIGAHYTKIVIVNCDKSLLRSVLDKKTRTMLGRTYSRFLEKEERFKIRLGGDCIKPFTPPLIKVNGVPKLVSITEEDSRFMYEGQEYTFSGWVGAVTDMKQEENVGIDILAPSGRVIVPAHRSKDLLGGKTSRPFRMITGQLMTGEGEWTPAMDKVGFALGEEFLKQFDKALGDIPEFEAFKQWVYGYSVRANRPKPKPDVESPTVSTPKTNRQAAATSYPIGETAQAMLEEPTEESVVPEEHVEEIVLEGKKYCLVSSDGHSTQDDFLSLDTSDPSVTTIRMNVANLLLSSASLNPDSWEVLRSLAFAIALARNRAMKLAGSTPDDLIRELNTVLRKGIL